MRFPRSSGILLHPTSLPGHWGIGDLGPAAYQFIDFLAMAGQRLWQILPLGPTGYGDSPYQCFSAFAGNPMLISPERLIEGGLLTSDEVEGTVAAYAHAFSPDRVNYGAAIEFKFALLHHSFARFRNGSFPAHTEAFNQFCTANARWLDDYALFMAIKERHGGASWNSWERDIATRKPAALKRWSAQVALEIEMQKYFQYLFFSQWQPLKAYANERDIRIIGDAPIFVAYDSADVWANPKFFFIDDDGNPSVVAGVPPDYFSATGQRWGNPLYRWDRMAKNNYAWWHDRLKTNLTSVDILRLDHFRGFAAYWEVPATEETAIKGKWADGPGAAFFSRLERALGDLPLIAEDLGLITPDVEELREQFKLPGMKVLQFAFGDDAHNPYLPHNYTSNYVVYTGTHDNNTTLGWFQDLSDPERERVQRYLGRDGSDISWDMIRLALGSVADMCIIPLQDVLRLGADARMNLPGMVGGNWSWRCRAEAFDPGLAFGLRLLTETYGRVEPLKPAVEAEEAIPAVAHEG